MLPDAVGSLTALRVSERVREWVVGAAGFGRQPHRPDDLNVSGNELSVLPDSVGNLTALDFLNVSGTGVSVLPEWVGSLTALEFLNVSGTGCRCCRIRSATSKSSGGYPLTRTI